MPVISSPKPQVAAAETSPTDIFLSGEPLTKTMPSSTSRSAGSISIACPATSSIFSLAFLAALSTARPPMKVPREANVPVQSGEESVLETSMLTDS